MIRYISQGFLWVSEVYIILFDVLFDVLTDVMSFMSFMICRCQAALASSSFLLICYVLCCYADVELYCSFVASWSFYVTFQISLY